MKTRYAALTLALGLAANAPAFAADCSVTVNSIVAQMVVLKANCGNNSTDITWLKNAGALSGVLTFPQTNADIFYTTPLLSGVNSYTATTTTGSGASALAAIITGAQWLLTVAPTTGGTVNGSLGVINACTSVGGVCSASYDNGASVILTATPQGSTNVFSGWSGDCSGTGSCVLAMTAPRTVIATFAPVPVAGACGAAQGVATATTPEALCGAGTPSGVTSPSNTWTWSCAGLNNGSNANCSAPQIVAGACGSANGGASVSATPTGTEACASGTITGMTTVGTNFQWTCGGINGGTPSATCSVAQTSTPGACAVLANAPESWNGSSPSACTAGSVASLAAAGNAWGWTCSGLGGGAAATGCTAPQQRAGACGSANNVPAVVAPSGASLCANGTTASVPTGSGPWNWTCTGINGVSTEASCSAPSGGGSATDTGRNSGLWMPVGSNTIFVVDQMGVNGAGNVDYVPGCINQTPAPANSSSGCAGNSSFSASYASINRSVNLTQGNIVSLRFTSTATAPSNKQVALKSATGGTIGFMMSLWVSAVPPGTAGGNFADVAAGCKQSSSGTPYVYTSNVAGYCPILPNTPYYVNIRSDAPCSGATCRFQIQAGADLQ